ncbi:amino acid adenylation domain-containing protein [Lentzea sp. DG1S-22]|uniref:amino acid adenylation domain-containing protein n=1 Tax=Lentzea sp. DG1S-22 TaxID=3108822 RepID=UPI002E77AB1F|nr:amino acid adenylation domain-containing protein [Lentzea sp. DG1S-22]WVH82085.1 amino acid adenylation domain-containing protein [Lentzea sp. DG1S-22]
MTQATRPAAAAWVVEGWPESLRDHPSLTVHTSDVAVHDDAQRDDLVRDAVAAAWMDSRPFRVVVAELGTGHALVIVTTTDGSAPRDVLSWLADPDAPFPRPVDPEAHAGPRVDLPAALRDGGTPSWSTATVRLPFDTAAVDSYAGVTGASAEAVLATAVGVLLDRYRYEADVDLLVLTPRPVAVVVRTGTATRFSELVRQVEKDLAAATPAPDGVHATVAVRREGASEPERVGQCVASPVSLPDGTTRYELDVALVDAGLRVDHDASLYSEAAVTAFASRLAAVLEAAQSDPVVDDMPATTALEREALARWACGETQQFTDACLHTLVELQARARPSTAAIVCGGVELTYAELDAKANQVAHRLLAEGIATGDLVALLADRAADSVVAMLGVLKAGAAYVPVEPSYPAERIRHIVTDSGARLVLARRDQTVPDLPVPVVVVQDVADQPDHSPRVAVTQDDLAYVIYTSGSTGLPKGVAVHHRAIVVSTHARGVGGPPPQRDLVTMPLCFDGAAGGLYWTITGGGTAVLPTETEAHDPSALARLLRRLPVTHIHSVPSHYGLVLEATAGAGLEHLRLVSVGGEPMPPQLVARHLLEHPDALLLNDYGPTECAVWASAHPCDIVDATRRKIPIGPPLPNYRLHVLDEHLREVPPGLPGEIYIGGPGVARGYHRRPGLTAQRFLPDPFGGPGDRLYRTGDRGQWTAEGELLITGRVDNQVKLRGFRVELGEIEAAVRRHPSVSECVVLLRTAPSGADIVTAFAASADEDLAEDQLRAEVERILPAYMQPDHYVLTRRLPRAPSGKLDVQAMRALEPGQHPRP